MLLRILSESFMRRKRRKILGVFAVSLGASLATAVIGISLEVGDKVSRELNVYGSNIVVHPSDIVDEEEGPVLGQPRLDESDLPKMKTIFWGNNIMDFAPFLLSEVTLKGETISIEGTWFSKEMSVPDGPSVRTGVETLFPTWHVEGSWPRDDQALREVLVGKEIAAQFNIHPSQKITIEKNGKPLEVLATGILNSGEQYDSKILVDLDLAQGLTGLPKGVDQVFVRALTIPEDDFLKLYARHPQSLSPQEYERWSCSPYVSTVAAQLQEAIAHAVAEPILEVSQREGVLLKKLKGLFIFICAVALLAAGVALTTVLMATVVERRQEVGLLRALGAGSKDVVLIFLSELAVMAILGSFLGGALGYGLGQWISFHLFHSFIQPNPMVLFIVAGVTLTISLMGGLFPIRFALKVDPVRVLHEI
ncbi:MAG: ABC transporter permease [Chlamydiae bacterium]|nr:ABC transporter permease [Chlamydiota bacterium]MBI3265516.1 ABC transporter permease [Chlamydiota bacterium]